MTHMTIGNTFGASIGISAIVLMFQGGFSMSQTHDIIVILMGTMGVLLSAYILNRVPWEKYGQRQYALQTYLGLLVAVAECTYFLGDFIGLFPASMSIMCIVLGTPAVFTLFTLLLRCIFYMLSLLGPPPEI